MGSSEISVYFLLEVINGCGRKTVYLFEDKQLFLLTDMSVYSVVTML